MVSGVTVSSCLKLSKVKGKQIARGPQSCVWFGPGVLRSVGKALSPCWPSGPLGEEGEVGVRHGAEVIGLQANTAEREDIFSRPSQGGQKAPVSCCFQG